MDYGNIESQNTDGLTEVIYDSGEIAAAVSGIDIVNLSDVNTEYQLIHRVIGAATNGIILRFNADTDDNYGNQYMAGSNTTESAYRSAASSWMYQSFSDVQSGRTNFAITDIHSISGLMHTVLTKNASSINGTTIDGVMLCGSNWNNTDELTDLEVLDLAAHSGIGIGSRFILLRKVVAATDTTRAGVMNVKGKMKYAWQEVYKTTLTGTSNGITISSLTGNTDVLYRLTMRYQNANTTNSITYLRMNNDSTANIYGCQFFEAYDTTVEATRQTQTGVNFGHAGTNVGTSSHSQIIIYGKSGYVRPMILTEAMEIGYGSSPTCVRYMDLNGWVYNETSTEITSMTITPSDTNGLDVGTYICLERLNL